jgi:hypothetical protein
MISLISFETSVIASMTIALFVIVDAPTVAAIHLPENSDDVPKVNPVSALPMSCMSAR